MSFTVREMIEHLTRLDPHAKVTISDGNGRVLPIESFAPGYAARVFDPVETEGEMEQITSAMVAEMAGNADLQPAFDQIERVLILSTERLDGESALAREREAGPVREFIESAAALGVARIH